MDLTNNKVELPSADGQGRLPRVELTGWQKAEKSRGLRIELEDGSLVTCTPSHRFPVARNGQVVMTPSYLAWRCWRSIAVYGRAGIPLAFTPDVT